MTPKFFSDQMDAENDRSATDAEIECQKQEREQRRAKRHVDQQAADYRPTRGTIDDPLRTGADSILRAVDKGGAITMETLTELLELLRTKTNYQFHIQVGILSGARFSTLDNERDAKETIRRLNAKP